MHIRDSPEYQKIICIPETGERHDYLTAHGFPLIERFRGQTTIFLPPFLQLGIDIKTLEDKLRAHFAYSPRVEHTDIYLCKDTVQIQAPSVLQDACLGMAEAEKEALFKANPRNVFPHWYAPDEFVKALDMKDTGYRPQQNL